MDRGAWWATNSGIAKSQTQLSDCTDTHTHTLVPGTEDKATNKTKSVSL